MRLPRKSKKETGEPGPEDTQEMFTAGHSLPEDPDETREYELDAVAEGVIEAETAEFSAENGTLEASEWEQEYEEWEEDEGFEPDDEFVEPEDPEEPQQDADPEAQGESRVDDLKDWFGEFKGRARVIWSGSLERIGSVRIPRREIDGQKAMAAGGILLIALLVGAGGYMLGKGTGDDIDQARLEGEFAGKKAGAVEGATRGYAAGFKKGRDLAFRKSYSASYKRNYIRAYDNAGMEPPKAKSIEVPEP